MRARPSRPALAPLACLAVLAFVASTAVPVPAQVSPDVDLDGYADCRVPGCNPGGLLCGDRNDADGNVNPAEAEVRKQRDDDYVGLVDDGFPNLIVSRLNVTFRFESERARVR